MESFISSAITSPCGSETSIWDVRSPKHEPIINTSPSSTPSNDDCPFVDQSFILPDEPFNLHAFDLSSLPCFKLYEDLSSEDENVEQSNELIENNVDDIMDCLDDWKAIDQLMKEEPLPFADWLEEKITLPLFNPSGISEYTRPNAYQNNVEAQQTADYPTNASFYPNNPKPTIPVNANNSEMLLREFETVYVCVKNNLDLTPPQSPPNPKNYGYLESTNNTFYVDQSAHILPASPVSISGRSSSNGDEDLPLQSNDWFNTLLNTPQTVNNDAWIENLVSSPKSWTREPVQSSSSSAISSPEYTASYSETSADEWLPPNGPKCSFVPNASDADNETNDEPVKKSRSKKSKAKPYDRKTRKKEQNKNAATRYRQKKKAEVEVILNEERVLEEKNDKVKERVTDLTREINYLKGLMRDLFKAKGILVR